MAQCAYLCIRRRKQRFRWTVNTTRLSVARFTWCICSMHCSLDWLDNSFLVNVCIAFNYRICTLHQTTGKYRGAFKLFWAQTSKCNKKKKQVNDRCYSCVKNTRKLAYSNAWFQKNFRGLYPDSRYNMKGGKKEEGMRGKGSHSMKGREGRGWEEELKGREES